jgi:hypothetical protein
MMKKIVYIGTFGCKMGAVLYDHCALSRQDLVNVYVSIADDFRDFEEVK